MSRNETDNDQRDGPASGPGFDRMPWCSKGAGWPSAGGGMGQMMLTCPCGGWLRRHRLAAYAALTLAGLGFLALQVGWILGVIAFFRTL